jgi:DNA-binding NarL/FixJ family response regulator
MNILLIDDEPVRMKDRIPACYFPSLYVAHGTDQVSWYLKDSGIKFDIVLLDHDMPLCNGLDIATYFLIERNIPVVVHSMNSYGAEKIVNQLNDYAVPNKRIRLDDPNFWDWVEQFIKVVS